MLRHFLQKNKDKKCDEDARSVKKGNQFEADKDSGLAHHLKVIGANEHDVTVTAELLHGEKKRPTVTVDISVRKNARMHL